MNIALAFMRIFFVIISVFFMTTYMISVHTDSLILHIIIGISLGLLFGGFLIAIDMLFRRYNLRSFNIVLIGIFLGYLMGKGLVLILDNILYISAASFVLPAQVIEIIKIAFFLFGIHLGTIITLRASDELYVSIPFVRFTPTIHRKKDILIDGSVLGDSRIIDLAASGLLDHHLIVPRFVVKELYVVSEIGDEISKARGRKCLENLKKLEEIDELDIRYNDTDFPDVKDHTDKLLRLARLLDANILSADISKVKVETLEGVRLINIHSLSNALKPIMETGEHIKIKIQRYGKEPRQGVGYLEDGTMVVVNGGGDYIGEIIEARVISVKHTGTGAVRSRMIFCNAIEDGEEYHGE